VTALAQSVHGNADRNGRDGNHSRTRKRRRKLGRPASGCDPTVTIRLPQETIDDLTEWGNVQGLTSRSDIIREIIAQWIHAQNAGESRKRLGKSRCLQG